MGRIAHTPFTYYTFRYDYTDDDKIEKIKNYFIREYPKYAIFKEVSKEVGKKHLQGKIGRALSLEQCRKLIIKEFPNTFIKTNYSMSLVDKPEEYDSYICKDGNVLCNNIFEPDFIHAQVDKHHELVVAFEKKKQKIGALSFIQKVAQDFVRENPVLVSSIQYGYHNVWKPSEEEIKRYDDACGNLLKYILKRLGSQIKIFDNNILQRMYTGIKNHIILLDEKCTEINFNKYKNVIQL